MDNTELVVDTSVFIEFLRAKDKTQAILFNIPSENP
jgi:hypothetical protein